ECQFLKNAMCRVRSVRPQTGTCKFVGNALIPILGEVCELPRTRDQSLPVVAVVTLEFFFFLGDCFCKFGCRIRDFTHWPNYNVQRPWHLSQNTFVQHASLCQPGQLRDQDEGIDPY